MKRVKRVVLGEGTAFMVRLWSYPWENVSVELGRRDVIGIWNNNHDRHTGLNHIEIAGKKIRLIAEIIESPKPIIRERKK